MDIALKVGYWLAMTTAILVLLIDVGMIASTILFPISNVNSIESYAASFTNWQMLPFIPSIILAPVFAALMLSIHHYASEKRKFFSQLALSFGLICAGILATHYYIQLSVVQYGLLNGQTDGLWLLVTPNPHSLFWSLAALGYGFMGFSLLSAAPIFSEKGEKKIKVLMVANGGIGAMFLVGNALGLFTVNILASFIWGVLFPITCILIARTFKLKAKQFENQETG